MQLVSRDDSSCSLYRFESDEDKGVVEYIASTPMTRQICNDPLLFGFQYTEALKGGVREVLRELSDSGGFTCREAETVVLHILRGGINFGIREALGEELGWNNHGSAFLSAQRQLSGDGSEWSISEDSYKKIYLGKNSDVIFGDVVATGTSLAHGLEVLFEQVVEGESAIDQLVFFTIGGELSTEILSQYSDRVDKITVIYFEGKFAVASEDSLLSIKIPGTDLLRRDCEMAPEFISSQYENPLYPLERCTIYDAGSRAFYQREYLEDLIEYWQEVRTLAEGGMLFSEYLAERAPVLDPERFQMGEFLEAIDTHMKKLKSANSIQ